VRKRPEIPEDVFFDTTPARGNGDPDEEPRPDPGPEPPAEPEEAPAGDVLAKSMASGSGRGSIKVSEYRAEQERKAAERERRRREAESGAEDETDDEPARVGRPPAQEGPKVAVTLYLTEPVAHLLEEVKFRLLTEYDVKTSKSAIADFAMRNGLDDLQAAADDLRRD